MAKNLIIKPEALSVEGFAPYGTAILKPTPPAPKRGDDWDCWYFLGSLGMVKATVGIVVTRPFSGEISTMEAHAQPEFLLPLDKPVIQAVALPADLSDPATQPDASTVKAFLLEPGQSIIIGRGVWHWAAIPTAGETWYYFLGHEASEGPGTEEEPWIPFKNNDTISIEMS